MESGICLICNAKGMEGPISSFQELSFPRKNLSADLVLKHVLELSSQLVENLTRRGSSPNLGELVKICLVCNESYVSGCMEIFMELLEVKGRFRDAKLKLIEAVRRSVQFEKAFPIQQEEDSALLEGQDKVDIYNEIRQFVDTYEYGHPESSPLIEDFLEDIKPEEPEAISTDKSVVLDEIISFGRLEKAQIDHITDEFETDPLSLSLRHEEDAQPFSPASRGEAEDKDDMEEEEQQIEHDLDYKSEEDSSPIFEAYEDNSRDEDWNEEMLSSESSAEQEDDEMDNDDDEPTPETETRRAKRNQKSQSSESGDDNSNKEKFQCDQCDQSFSNNNGLKLHMREDHGVNHLEFHCSFAGCKRYFKHESFLKYHEEAHLNPQSPYWQLECVLCGVKFKQERHLLEHLKDHETSGVRFHCDQCPASYTRQRSLNDHVKKVHTSEARQKSTNSKLSNRSFYNKAPDYKCSNCGLTVVRKQQMEYHIEKVHKGNASIIRVDDTGRIIQDPEENKKVVCPICKIKLSTRQSLRYHLTTHDKDKESFQCEHCEKKFSLQPRYHNHLGLVHGMQEYLEFKCSFEGCEKAFAIKWVLKRHIESAHEGPKFVCEKCGKRFEHKHNLTRHESAVHTDKALRKTFDCKECGMKFNNPYTLKNHKQDVHKLNTGEIQIFKCTLCEATFKNELILRQHVKRIHEKKYEVCCDMCGKILADPGSLRQHRKRAHNIGDIPDPNRKYPCIVEGCGKSFSSRKVLDEHTLFKHEGKRRYQCEECGQKLSTEKALRKHILVMHKNRESKPFKCNLCGKGFAVKQYLTLHQKTHQAKKDTE